MSMFSQKVKDMKTLEKILDEIEEKLDKLGYPKEEKFVVMLAMDELTTNAVSYTTDPKSVSINYTLKKTEAKLKVKNKGEPFDWKQYITPGYLKKINSDAQAHGRGINMTHKLMDELSYEFKKGYITAYARYKRN